MKAHKFKSFQIVYNPLNGDVDTIYEDGAQCKVWVNEEDIRHGKLLGISGGEHKVLHEIVHQLLSIHMGNETCPIIYAESHKQPMPYNAEHLENLIMAMSYFSLDKPMEYNEWWMRIGYVQSFTNPYILKEEIRSVYFKLTQ